MNSKIAPMIATALIAGSPAALTAAESPVLDTLRPTIAEITASFDSIPSERKEKLKELAGKTRESLDRTKGVRLTFICTHNSRRSHLSQIWTQTAAAWYGVPGVETFSGGTEATACNIRTVHALRRAGFSIINPEPGAKNPGYLVQFSDSAPPLKAFSKVYHKDGNPQSDFIAVMTCSHADENCPLVHGASARVAVPFEDPKVSDGTGQEAATYDARSRQIASEMFYFMSLVRSPTP